MNNKALTKNNVPELRFVGFNDDWKGFKLKKLGKPSYPAIKAGPFGSAIKKEFYVSSGYKVYGQEQVISGNPFYGDYYINEEKFNSLKSCSISPGDILISLVGTIGNVLLIPDDAEEGVINPRLLRISLDNKKAFPVFVKYFLELKQTQNQLKSLAQGGTMGVLNAESLKNLTIVSPDIQEQQKIAAFLTAVDNKLAALKRKHELLQTYKRGLMQKIFSQELRFKADDGSEFPEWEKTTLKKVSSIYDGTHQTPNYVESGIPFYTVEHVTSNNFNKTKFIAESVYQDELKRVAIEKNDILMTRIGDIGTPKLINWDVKASFYVSLALIKCNSLVISEFIFYFIQTEFFQKELHQRTIHVAFPKKINLGEIGKCLTLIPTLEEQQKIAKFLSAIDKKITAVSQQIEQAEQFKQGLLQKMFI